MNLKLVKLIGDVMAHPDKFKTKFNVRAWDDMPDGQAIVLIDLDKELADLIRGLKTNES